MKKYFILLLVLSASRLYSQSTNDILNLLVANKTITQEQADSLRAEASIKEQESAAKKKSFQITSGKALKINGYGQFRYQYFQEDQKAKVDGFDIRRAYLDIKGDITPYWSYRLQTDFATSPKIIDVYTELKPLDEISFTIGQQLLPFSLNNVTSNTKLILADRAQVVEAATFRRGDILGDNNGRDIGITVFGSLISFNDTKLVEYRIGVFNGSGINRPDLTDGKDISGRLILHPVKGLDLGGSFVSGWTPDSLSLSKIGINVSSEQLGKRKRFGGEINYTYKFLSASAEYIVFQDGEVSRSGYYAQLAAFLLPNKIQLAGRYESFDKDLDKDDNIFNNITFGLNYYINPNVALQAAYTFKQEEGTSVDNNFTALQLQISF
jgi:phosphate-selective porin OprO and OprP